MKAAVFAYSRQGCRTARQVLRYLEGQEVRAYTMERFDEPGFQPLPRPGRPLYREVFSWADAMVFVGSVGIAVREIAPFVKDKRTDPAVLSIDELGTFVIPILSGHIGGANAIALELAHVLKAEPVITTATDINGKFSVDAWAARQGLFITDLKMAKRVSATILEQNVPFSSDFPIVGSLPGGLVQESTGEIGICVSCRECRPFDRTMLLVPPVLHLGIGCRRGIQEQEIGAAVDTVLKEHGFHPKAVKLAASIDRKADEAGLLSFCQKRGLPLSFYTADALRALPGDYTASQRVLQVTGVDNVCERAAMVGAERLLVRKTIQNGVTVAVAAESWEVRFE